MIRVRVMGALCSCRRWGRLFWCVTGVAGWLGLAATPGVALAPAEQADLQVDVVATGFSVVWDMRFLPDGGLLVTERTGGIKRVDPKTGQVQTLAQLAVAQGVEAGLFGLALDPSFPAQPYIYVAYTYLSEAAIRNRVSRLTYQGATLGAEQVLLERPPRRGRPQRGASGFRPGWKPLGHRG